MSADDARPRIDLLAPPFAGHLHPILAIGRALQPIADIRVISTEGASSRIRLAGLDGVAVVPGADAALRAITDPPHPVGAHPLRLHAQFERSLALMEAFAAALDAQWSQRRPDLVIADFTLPVAGSVARRHRIPWWTSHPSPCVIEAPGGPPAYLGGWLPGVGAFGRARDAVAARAVRTFKRGVHRLHRRRLAALGFPSLYRDDGSEAAYSDECILGLGLRELEFARDWPQALIMCSPRSARIWASRRTDWRRRSMRWRARSRRCSCISATARCGRTALLPIDPLRCIAMPGSIIRAGFRGCARCSITAAPG
jgi:UDP:flavonoid glycosyltransferase YjiC (YdhE family)